MAKYKKGSVAGETWTRSFQVIINNEYGKMPTIRYDEEDMIQLGDGKVISNRQGDNITYPFNLEEAGTSFRLKNPLTDEYVDAYATYQDVFVLMHSLYFHLADLRDRGTSPYPSWSWNASTSQWEAPITKPEVGNWVWDEIGQQWIEQ
jgi:hypothetical protein